MTEAGLASHRVRIDVILDVVRADIAERIAAGRAVIIAVTAAGRPVIILGRILDRREAERDAERVVGELVHGDRGDLPALVGRLGIELAILTDLALRVDRDRVLLAQRIIGLQVDAAGEAVIEQVGRRGLDDLQRLEQIARILAVIEAAIVIDGRDHAAIEGRGRVIGAEAADRDIFCAAGGLLDGDAGQARERVGDRDVGQLADILGRDRFDDVDRVLLRAVGVLDRAGIARDDDLFDRCVRVGACRPRPRPVRRCAAWAKTGVAMAMARSAAPDFRSVLDCRALESSRQRKNPRKDRSSIPPLNAANLRNWVRLCALKTYEDEHRDCAQRRTIGRKRTYVFGKYADVLTRPYRLVLIQPDYLNNGSAIHRVLSAASLFFHSRKRPATRAEQALRPERHPRSDAGQDDLFRHRRARRRVAADRRRALRGDPTSARRRASGSRRSRAAQLQGRQERVVAAARAQPTRSRCCSSRIRRPTIR